MKKSVILILSALLAIVLVAFTGCSKATTTTTSAIETTTTNTVAITSTATTTVPVSTIPIQIINYPLVSNTNPGYGDTLVPVNQSIAITFSEAMNPSTINTNTFTLWQGTTPVAGNTVAYYGNTAILNPQNDLAKGTTYTAKVTADVTDMAGHHLLSDYTWNFATGTIDTVAPSVVSTIPAAVTINPTDPDNPFGTSTNVPINDAITAYFSEGMDPTTINTNTFTIMQGTTPVAGAVTFDGFETAVFTPTAALTPNTQYTATITTGATCLGGNTIAQNFAWTFTTGPAQTTVPMVVSTIPASDDTGVPINSSVSASFSEAINPMSINTSTFVVTQGNAIVPGTVSFNGVNMAVFTPTNDLTINTSYVVTITTGVTDLAGIPMASNYTWNFMTGTADTVLPTVSSVSPVSGATAVSKNAAIVSTFSEAIDPTTLVFTLAQGNAMIMGTLTYSTDLTMVTFTPGTALAANTMYTVTVDGFDLAGNGPATQTWSFTTSQ
jgi:Bacterial Ig-like domain